MIPWGHSNIQNLNPVVQTEFLPDGRQLVRFVWDASLSNEFTLAAVGFWSGFAVEFEVQISGGVSPGWHTNEYWFTSTGSDHNCEYSTNTDPGYTNGYAYDNDNCYNSDDLEVIIPPGSSALDAYKEVKGALDASYNRFPNFGTTYSGGVSDYRINISNPNSTPMNDIVIVDVFPHVGDTEVLNTNIPRNSGWRPELASAISAPSGVTVFYSTVSNPCRTELANPGDPIPFPSGCNNPNWTTSVPSNLANVTAVKFDFGSMVLNQGQTVTIDWQMTAPNGLSGTEGIAWNSFGYKVSNASTGAPLLSSEPIKVGVQILPPPCLPFSPTGWDYGCEDDICVDIIGEGAKFNIPKTINIPNSGNVTQIVAIATYNHAPTACGVFSTNNGQSIDVESIPLGNNGCGGGDYFMATLNAASSVTFDGPDPIQAESLVLYVFRLDASYIGQTCHGDFNIECIFQNTHCFTYNFPSQYVPRDIEVTLPLSEITNDGRIATITGTACGASQSVTINNYTNGNSLNIVNFTINNVPASCTSMQVCVDSPVSNGQSLFMTGAMQAEIQCSDCNPITNAGTIGTDQELCGTSGDPATLTNIASPSGGAGSVQYVWMSSTTSCIAPSSTTDPNWNIIAGATLAIYNPPVINTNTCYVRMARRADCDDYLASNVVEVILKCSAPPVINNVGSNGTYNCTTTPTFSNPTVSSDCDITSALSYTDFTVAGSCAGDATRRVWTVTDECNNVTTAEQIMTPFDNSDPNITCPANTTIYFDANCNYNANPSICLLYTSPSPRDQRGSRMPSSA